MFNWSLLAVCGRSTPSQNKAGSMIKMKNDLTMLTQGGYEIQITKL